MTRGEIFCLCDKYIMRENAKNRNSGGAAVVNVLVLDSTKTVHRQHRTKVSKGGLVANNDIFQITFETVKN